MSLCRSEACLAVYRYQFSGKLFASLPDFQLLRSSEYPCAKSPVRCSDSHVRYFLLFKLEIVQRNIYERSGQLKYRKYLKYLQGQPRCKTKYKQYKIKFYYLPELVYVFISFCIAPCGKLCANDELFSKNTKICLSEFIGKPKKEVDI